MAAKLIRIVLAALAIVAAAPGLRAEPLTVFGAASLTDVLSEIGAGFEEETGTKVRFSFAASSTVARQIEAGAPVDVVALASTDWADYLAARGLIGEQVFPAANRLALVAPAGIVAADPLTREAFTALIGTDGRIAVGDPAHVPAGVYARQALENLGLWQIAEPRLAPTDNVRAALALVARGEAALGVVYLTDAAIADVAVLAEVPASAHAPIAYPFAIVADGPAARAFLSYVTGGASRAIFRRHGFQVE
ncbi:MAG: molybdate ABC transporter substrate-binding protein [Paracoccaceae bacterium]|nr:molybdate ABC transporter substrate-binding protein [Paracoccaceae bacterium]